MDASVLYEIAKKKKSFYGILGRIDYCVKIGKQYQCKRETVEFVIRLLLKKRPKGFIDDVVLVFLRNYGG